MLVMACILFDPQRHEKLNVLAWSARQAQACINAIVADTEQRFDPQNLWPVHTRDRAQLDGTAHGLTPLYYGACGVVWALHYLQDVGAVTLQRHSYLPFLETARALNHAWLGEVADVAAPSYLMGDTPFLMQQWAHAHDRTALADSLAALIERNMHNPQREFMWAAPGTLLAALFLHQHSGGDARWAELFVQTAAALRSQLLWSDEHQCHYWSQDLYGRLCTYLDAVHGFVATACVLIQGRHLLGEAQWQEWERCIVQTVTNTATVEDGMANWRPQLIAPPQEAPRTLMQFCHGAPGFVICLAQLPGQEMDALLLQAGEAIWTAGPLAKGANLCHGTGGNGYAFLALYQRTGDSLWLDRARAFAMHGMVQAQADWTCHGHGQYSLWTGDLGFAVYLWDCITAKPKFPTLEVFFHTG